MYVCMYVCMYVIPEPPATLQVLPPGEFNDMSSLSHVSHCMVLPLGKFTVMISEPNATLQGAVTWRNQCHDRATLQGVRISSALLSCHSRQRERLSASMLSICLSVCLLVCLFVCLLPKCKNVIFSKTKLFRAIWSLLTTYRKLYMGFSKNPLLDP